MADKSVILVIDDNMLVCTIVKDILKTKYEHIITMQDAEQGIAMAKKVLPDLILLDVVLISTDGFQVCQKIKANSITKHIPVMFVTSESGREIISHCFEAGAVDYIRKPFVPVELLARVGVHLENRKRKLEMQTLIKEMASLLSHDELTKVYTRRFFMQEIQRYLAIKHQFTLAIVDVDNFKVVNDSYGHIIGDSILALVAKALQDNCRQGDLVARWGGEEFIMMFPSTGMKATAGIVERMRKTISEIEVPYENQMVRVTATFGFCEAQLCLPIEKNITMADKALYEGKKQGKNCCIRYHE